MLTPACVRELGRQGCGLDHLTHEEEVATGGLRSRDAWGTCKSYRGVIKLPGYELWRRLDLKVYPPEEYAYAPLLSCTRRAPNHCCGRCVRRVHSHLGARARACIHRYALLYFTGSDHFNRSMRHYAKKRGYSLSDHGIVHCQVRSPPPSPTFSDLL